MGNGNLQELLGSPSKKTAQKAPEVAVSLPDVGQDQQAPEGIEVREISVEAVVGGVLQRITLGGILPQEVSTVLRAWDPNAQWRDDFPRKGNFGARETKLARALVLSVRASDSGIFWDLVCQNGEDLSVAVSKKKSPEMLDLLAGIGKIAPKHLDKLRSAIDGKGAATVILPEAEQFGVQFWTTDDGKAFLDGVQADPPAAKGGDHE